MLGYSEYGSSKHDLCMDGYKQPRPMPGGPKKDWSSSFPSLLAVRDRDKIPLSAGETGVRQRWRMLK